MPINDTIQCPHELRAGIKVCYHCAHDARVAATKRRVAVLKRVAGVGLVLAAIFSVGVPGLQLLRSGEAGAGSAAAPPAEPPAEPRAEPLVEPLVEPSAALPAAPVTEAVAVPPVASGILAEESSEPMELSGGFSATRSGDTVTVSFDTMMLRTRRPEKFEDILRSSLPQVYGETVAAALSNIPRGSLVQVEDLFAELPTSGLRIALAGGDTLALWPQTRERDDGPLVVAYRAIVTR